MKKKLSSMTILALTVVILFGFGQAFGGMYKAGTYKASAQGKSKKVPIEVEVTVDASKIKEIKILSHKESVEDKKYGEVVTEALTKFPEAIVKANSIDVDAVAKATITSNAVALAVAKALNKALVVSTKYKAGTYKASAQGKSKKVPIEVEVTVSDSKIKEIKILSHKESVEDKKYGAVVTDALTKYPASIVKANSVDVDAIAQATVTSNAVALAVAKALDKARVK
ncbi:MAG: FMN-binding protein [Syntrophales bacterium]|nr:FMN-binding protein [Syntrophales bacterium]